MEHILKHGKKYYEDLIRAVGLGAAKIREAMLASLHGGTEGLGVFRETLRSWGPPSHLTLFAVSGDDDYFEAEQYKKDEHIKADVFRISPRPLGGDLRLAERIFKASRGLVNDFLSRYGGYDVCNVVGSSMGASSYFTLLMSREYAEQHAGQMVLIDIRIPNDKPTSLFRDNIGKVLSRLWEFQEKSSGTKFVIVPYAASQDSLGRGDIAEARFIRNTAIAERGDWYNILGSFANQGEEGLHVALPVLIRADSEGELISKAQSITRGSAEAFRADRLILKPAKEINVAVAVVGPKQKTDLHELAERIRALLVAGLLHQLLGRAVTPGRDCIPIQVQGRVWRAVALIGPFILEGVMLEDARVNVEKRSWGELL